MAKPICDLEANEYVWVLGGLPDGTYTAVKCRFIRMRSNGQVIIRPSGAGTMFTGGDLSTLWKSEADCLAGGFVQDQE